MATKSIPGSGGGRSVPGGGRPAGRPGGRFITSVPRMPTSGQYANAHRRQIRNASGQFAGGWGFAWQGLAETDDAMYDAARQLDINIEDAMQRLANEIREWMQANAPWEDDTGDARANLQAIYVRESNNTFSIWVGHGPNIYYGVWLEVRWGGRYAIVGPAVQKFGPMLGARIRGLA